MGEPDATMGNQQRHWSRHASRYHDLFVDPFAEGVENPLWKALDAIDAPLDKTAIDLGCGTGPLIPALARRFGRVIALDFAAGMLDQARKRLPPELSGRVRFLQRSMEEVEDLEGQMDVAVSINSLVMPDERQIDRTLQAIRRTLSPEGMLLGIVPAMDAIQYQTMLLLDQALAQGLEPRDAMRFTAHHAEHRYYDFAFGRFRFEGLRQKFWFPFEVEYRLSKAGFRAVTLSKVLYPWEGQPEDDFELSAYPPSWDWFFLAST